MLRSIRLSEPFKKWRRLLRICAV